MLKQIRENARIPLYILIAAFIGLYAISSHETAPPAGRVFGKNISMGDFQNAYVATRTQMIMKYGELPRSEQLEASLQEQTWDRIILLYEAKKEGIKVSDRDIAGFVQAMGVFNDKNGAFSRRLYEDILKYNFGLTPVQFEDIVRDDLKIRKLIDKNIEDVSVSDEDVLQQYKLAHEKAKVDYILAKSSDYLGQVSVTDEEVKAFFDKKADMFVIPERVNVEYIVKTFPDTKDESREKVRKEMLDVSYELAGNTDLDSVAKKFSLEVKETGLFSKEANIPGVGFDMKFAGAAFALDAGTLSKPFETDKGIYIIRVKEKVEEKAAEFVDVKDRVRAAVKAEKAGDVAKAKAEEALSEVKKEKAKFDGVAKKLLLTEKRTGPFTRSQYIEGIGISNEFADAALSMKEGEIFNRVIRVHDGYAVIKLDALIPIDEKKFQEEKDKFKELLLAQKQFYASMTWYNEIKKKAGFKSNLPSRP